jgi:hypothetical protein
MMSSQSEPHPSWSVGIDLPTGPMDEAIIEGILKRLGTRPLAWVWPASENLRNSSLPGRIAERRLSKGDIVFPKGFAGSLHPLLSQDELEKEVGWSLRNPWSTGVADLFGSAPDLLMPRLPDLARGSARALYREMGFRSIGVPMGASTAANEDGPTPVPYVRIPDAAGSPNGGLLRGVLSRRDAPLLLIDLSRILDSGSPSLLDAVLRAAARLTAFTGPWSSLFLLLPARDSAARCDGWDGIQPDAVRRRLMTVGALRRKTRRRNDEYRRILPLLTEGRGTERREDGCAEEALPAPQGRTLLAQMQGEVSLAGRDFNVLLSGGRFSGITCAGRTVLPRFPAESSLTVRGARLAFRTSSAFSFEGDGCTGLREELQLERHHKSSMMVDYFFLEGFPHLLIHVDVAWPDLGRDAPIDACVPFGMRLFPVHATEEILIHGSGPKENVLRISSGMRGGAATAVSGSFLHVSRGNDGVTLSFPTASGSSPGLVHFRVVKDGNGSWLEANPFGNWSAFRSDWADGRRECYSLAIGVGGATPPRRPPALPRKAPVKARP